METDLMDADKRQAYWDQWACLAIELGEVWHNMLDGLCRELTEDRD